MVRRGPATAGKFTRFVSPEVRGILPGLGWLPATASQDSSKYHPVFIVLEMQGCLKLPGRERARVPRREQRTAGDFERDGIGYSIA
jgi:hypothetical protein